MKNILYLSNIEVPYRVTMFNEFAKECNLTVLYERKKSSSRVEEWIGSEKTDFTVKYLKGIKLGGENTFSFGILRYLFKRYDEIIVGCYNSPVQMLAILIMKLFRKSYIVNLDGEPFLNGSGLKSRLKRFFLKGAKKYLVAGEKSAEALKSVVKSQEIIPYYFSSLTKNELKRNALIRKQRERYVLVVGQYVEVKGLDVALEAARRSPQIKYKFIGTGNKTSEFTDKYKNLISQNVEIIPFLNKKDLESEYQKCAVFVLPSRQECWGLVINEAASFGTPIVSTWGSGAAVEFLADEYSQYLAPVGDADGMLKCIESILDSDNLADYSEYLLKKSEKYSIENGVSAHCHACDIR